MKRAAFNVAIGPLLFLTSMWPSVGLAAAAREARAASHEIDFRFDDIRGQHLAKKILAKEMAEEADMPSDFQSFRTAWVNVSDRQLPDLFVMYGCSATDNCGLYGFEPTKSGWRLALNSIAQRCWILRSSHGGRRDISAAMHGSATESTIKTYWWRKNRYVRVSERNVIYK